MSDLTLATPEISPRVLVMGVSNEYSLGYHIARKLKSAGFEIALSYAKASLARRVLPLAQSLSARFCEECDVNDDAALDRLFQVVGEHWGSLDHLVHSIAFARPEDLERNLTHTPREGFRVALETSAYSLVAAAQRAASLMQTRGGCILTLTAFGSEKVIPGYGVMGVAKAALESSVRYLAHDLGSSQIRVNAISAGPVKTLSSAGIRSFHELMSLVKEKSPLRSQIDGQDVAELAHFLLSPAAKHMTGGIYFVDAGINIMGA